jgi:enoyl-CoA hydratase
MGSYNTIIYEKANAVAKIVFNRPSVLNALNNVMFTEIGDALQDAEEDAEIRVVLITGNGKAFCAGADLKFSREALKSVPDQEAFFRLGNELVIKRIRNLSKPVIAAVNGYAFGGGFEIMLACDLVIATEDAIMGDQHINVGLVGAGGSYLHLPAVVGLRRAKEIVLLGKRLTGLEAQRIGLVNMAVPSEKLEETANAIAQELAEKSPVALSISKKLLNQMAYPDFDARLELNVLSAIKNNTTEDYKEAIEAFNEKRKPIFKGR